MKISVFLNADVSNTNEDFYVMIENIYISVFLKYRYLHFSKRYLNSITYSCILIRDICNNNEIKISVFINRYICI